MVERLEDYPYSSYRAYICRDREDITDCDLILAMISGNNGESPDRYKAFVEDAIGRKVGNPLEHVYGGVILGGERYIEETLKRIAGKEVDRKEDISCRRALGSKLPRLDAEWIIDQVCSYFHISRDDVLTRKGEHRDLTIYLAKRYTNLSNRQIGEIFGDLSYSAVTKVEQRFRQKMGEGCVPGKKSANLGNLFVQCQGLTPALR